MPQQDKQGKIIGAIPGLKLLTGTAIGLTFFFPIYIIFFIFKVRINIPFWDEWDYIFFASQWIRGNLSPLNLFDWHNDHRIPLTRLVYIYIYPLFKGEMLVPLLLQFMAQFALLTLLWRKSTALFKDQPCWHRFFPVIISALLFAPQIMAIWIFGASFQQTWTYLFFAVTVFAFGVYKPAASDTALAVTAALAATTCSANALVVWPTLLVMSLFNKTNPRKIILLLACTLAVIALYYGETTFASFYTRIFEESPWAAPEISLWHRGRYTAAFIGSMFCRNNVLTAILWGRIGLLIYVLLILHWLFGTDKRNIRTLPWLALPTLAVVSAVAGSFRRIGFAGVEQALDSRYIALSNIFWIALTAILVVTVEKWKRGRFWGRIGIAGLLGIAAISYTLTIRPVKTQVDMVNDIKFSAHALRSGYYVYRYPGIVGLYPYPIRDALNLFVWMDENNFHPFRDRPTDMIGMNITDFSQLVLEPDNPARLAYRRIESDKHPSYESPLIQPGMEFSGSIEGIEDIPAEILLTDDSGKIIAHGSTGYGEYRFSTVFTFRQETGRWRAFAPQTTDDITPANAYIIRQGYSHLEKAVITAAESEL